MIMPEGLRAKLLARCERCWTVNTANTQIEKIKVIPS